MTETTPEPVKSPSIRRRLLGRALRVTLSFIIILVLAVGGFVLYAWLGSEEAPVATVADPKAKAQLEDRSKSVTLDPSAPVGVSVQSITSPTSPGSNVLMVVKTRPDATCTITAEYNKVKSTDSGLVEKTADDFGMAQWSWAVGPAVPEGKWPVTVTCSFNGKSGMVIGDLEVVSTQ